MSDKVVMKWDKKEQDWTVSWPDLKGKALSHIIFDMIRTKGHRTDWEKDLTVLLTERGYDFKTFKITVEKIKEPSEIEDHMERKEHE